MNLILAGAQCSDKCLADIFSPFIGCLSNNGESGLPLSQRDKNSAAATADDRIRLPVTNPGTFVNKRRPLIYRNPVLDLTAPACSSMTTVGCMSGTSHLHPSCYFDVAGRVAAGERMVTSLQP